MSPRQIEPRLRAFRSVIAATLAFVVVTTLAPDTAAAQDVPPIPKASPLRAGTPAAEVQNTAPAQTPPPTAGQQILLQGANSPFADAGADAPQAASRPLNQPAEAAPAQVPAATVGALPPSTTPQSASNPARPTTLRQGAYTLEARLWPGGPPLGDGVAWRIYDANPGPDGRMLLLGEASGGVIQVRLDPGTYMVHTGYGRAGTVKQIQVSDPSGGEVVSLNAGGMRPLAVNDREQTLRPGEVTFDIFAPDEGGSDERFLVVSGVPPGRVVSLNAGTYHVVCHYGTANAIVRADIRVDPGQLTEATMYQRAARLTLKLVSQRGGEAIANTEWSVVSPAGETVIESVGAFPNVVLAEGDYVAIARNANQIYEADFTVESGVHRDIEVLVR